MLIAISCEITGGVSHIVDIYHSVVRSTPVNQTDDSDKYSRQNKLNCTSIDKFEQALKIMNVVLNKNIDITYHVLQC